jgi:MinD-like ATPase involved in chromosome partitioning or flagellar assembly
VNESTKPRVFISYASENSTFIEQVLLPVLDAEGIAYWYSRQSLRSGPFPQEIAQALKECPYFLLVGSGPAVASDWVRDEACWALEHRRDTGRIFVFNIEPCSLDEIHPGLFRLHRAEYATEPDRALALLKSWAASLDYADRGHVEIVLNVIGARGGVGKSTIACRMAEMIAETGHSVLIVDLDTGAAGITALAAVRAESGGRALSTHEAMDAAASGHSLPPGIPAAQDVTPPYLSRHEGSGRVYLVPAIPPHGHARRAMREILTQIDQQGGAAVYGRILDDILARATAAIRAPLHCIVLDCGAEGEEFNPFVTAAIARSQLTYIVAQPDLVSPENVHRAKLLVAHGGGNDAASKIRLIINRVVSEQHEPVARASFSGFTIAGCIYDDRDYFEAIQKGRVNLEDYDTISRGIQAVLAYKNEIPRGMVPTLDDLWARRLARVLVEHASFGSASSMFERAMAKGTTLSLLLGSLLLFPGVAGAGIGLARIMTSYQGPGVVSSLPTTVLWIATTMCAGIGLTLIRHAINRRRELRKHLAMLTEIDRLLRTPKPYKALLDHFRTLAHAPTEPPDPRMVWMRRFEKAMSRSDNAV